MPSSPAATVTCAVGPRPRPFTFTGITTIGALESSFSGRGDIDRELAAAGIERDVDEAERAARHRGLHRDRARWTTVTST